MNKNLVSTYLACALITVGSLAVIDSARITYPLSIVTSTRSSELAVIGEGKAEAIPDTATISLGLTIQAPTASQAQTSIDTTHNAIIKAMQALSIPSEDIQTSGYSVQPNYSYEGSTQRIQGYNATATVTIKTKKLDTVDQIISLSTEAGANQVNNVSFSIEDPNALRAKARSNAIENAQKEAEKLSRELGISLGKVTNIVESQSTYPMPMYDQAVSSEISALKAGGGPEVQPGVETISTSVTLFFEKK